MMIVFASFFRTAMPATGTMRDHAPPHAAPWSVGYATMLACLDIRPQTLHASARHMHLSERI